MYCRKFTLRPARNLKKEFRAAVYCSMNNTSSIDRAVTLGTQKADVPSVLV